MRHVEPMAVLFLEDIGLEDGSAEDLACLQLSVADRHAHRPRRIALNLNMRSLPLSDLGCRSLAPNAPSKFFRVASQPSVGTLAKGSLSITRSVVMHPNRVHLGKIES